VSVKILAELSPASTKRTTFDVDPGTIAEIITNLNTGFPLRHARVCRNGEIVTDFTIRAEDRDTLWIKFVPYGTGTEMKAGGWALAAIGLLVGVTFGWTGFGAVAGAALIGSGLAMALGGTVLMNYNVPSLKEREKPDQDPSIKGGRNQMRQHGRISVLFGRHRLYPDLAANPHTSIVDGKQYFTQLFCGGYKDCVIDPTSFKLGDTSLVEFSLTKDINSVLSGADPYIRLEILQNGEASALYPYCVHEDPLNADLRKTDADGNPAAAVERSTPPNTGRINVDIFFYSGLGTYNSDGDLVPAAVEVKASYKPLGASDASYVLLGYFSEALVEVPGEVEGTTNLVLVPSNVITGAELKIKRFQITTDVPPGQYTVKIERVSDDSTDANTIDQVHVGSIRSTKFTRPIRDDVQQDLTVIALRVMAGSQFNGGVLEALNYVATTKLPVYSGPGTGNNYWLATAETRNPAAALLYVLQGRAAQEKVDADDIDWPSLEQWYLWCEARGYSCNAYLSESMPLADMIRLIGSTARADILRIDSKISVVIDAERPSPVQLFTPKNTKNYSVTMFSADIPDAVSLRFVNEGAGYASDEALIPRANTVGEPETVQNVDLWGVTNADQARRIGIYKYACLTHRPFVHAIDADLEYLLCNKGDWIQYAGDTALAGTTQGRIAEMLWSPTVNRYVGLRLDEPVETEPGQLYAVRIRRSNGSVLQRNVAVVWEPDEVYLTEQIEPEDAPQKGDLYAFGIRGREVLDLIITDIQPQADLSATLVCVEYSPELFGLDDPNYVLPPFDSKVTPVSGAVESGLVGTAHWRLFITYHDSEREPPRPNGDGQSGGWHYAHTTPSVWQSSKTAESVDSGEWGPPVRIKNERSNTDTVPIYLTLSTQTKILDCDSQGNLLAGSLPFEVWAELFKWNYRINPLGGMSRYPGTGGKLFDPMLGEFFPVEAGQGIVFSLVNAPDGVTINHAGLITVTANAALDDENTIIVQARYQGGVYTAALFIQVKKRIGANRYLGTVDTIPKNNAHVFILKGWNTGLVRAVQGDYVFAVASGTVGAHIWRIGYVYQWTGIKWEERDPVTYTELYILCFKDGLDVPELTQNMGWFGAVFAARIVTLKAFIEELEAQKINLGNGGQIKSINYLSGYRGFLIDGDTGDAEFNSTVVRGHIEASSGSFTGAITATSGSFTGTINAESGYFKGDLYAQFINISGEVEAGTNYVIRRNNQPWKKGSYGLEHETFIKEIVTAARGTVTARVMIKRPSYSSGSYDFILKVNEVPVATLIHIPTELTVIHEVTLTLSAAVSTISLYLGSGAPENTEVTTFEILCLDNPGFLRFLG